MNPLLVILVYGSAMALSLALLYFFHAPWYWRILSLAAALVLGLMPLPPEWKIPDLVVGFVVLFLLVWGAAAPAFRHVYRRREILKHA
jgi:hypothetical protein